VRNSLSGEIEGVSDDRGVSWGGVLRGRITDLRLKVQAELGSCQMNMRDVMKLKPGDVVTLDTRRDDAIVLRVENLAKFLGVPGVSRDGHAVRIIDRIVQGAAGRRAA